MQVEKKEQWAYIQKERLWNALVIIQVFSAKEQQPIGWPLNQFCNIYL